MYMLLQSLFDLIAIQVNIREQGSIQRSDFAMFPKERLIRESAFYCEISFGGLSRLHLSLTIGTKNFRNKLFLTYSIRPYKN